MVVRIRSLLRIVKPSSMCQRVPRSELNGITYCSLMGGHLRIPLILSTPVIWVLSLHIWQSTWPNDVSLKVLALTFSRRVPDAHTTTVTGLGWFKIFEDGFDGTTWGVQRMIKAHGNQTFTIPACLEPGNYFLRAEISTCQNNQSRPSASIAHFNALQSRFMQRLRILEHSST